MAVKVFSKRGYVNKQFPQFKEPAQMFISTNPNVSTFTYDATGTTAERLAYIGVKQGQSFYDEDFKTEFNWDVETQAWV